MTLFYIKPLRKGIGPTSRDPGHFAAPSVKARIKVNEVELKTKEGRECGKEGWGFPASVAILTLAIPAIICLELIVLCPTLEWTKADQSHPNLPSFVH